MVTITNSELLQLKGNKEYISSQISTDDGYYIENYLINGLGYKVKRKIGSVMFHLMVAASVRHITVAAFQTWQEGNMIKSSPMFLQSIDGREKVLNFIEQANQESPHKILHLFISEVECQEQYQYYNGIDEEYEVDYVMNKLNEYNQETIYR